MPFLEKLSTSLLTFSQLPLPWLGVKPDWEAVPYNTERMRVRGQKVYRKEPSLFALSYYGEPRLNVRQALGYLLLPKGELHLKRNVFSKSIEEFEKESFLDQILSVDAARVAAASFLQMESFVKGEGCFVVSTSFYTPLKVGDVIIKVEGKDTPTTSSFVEEVLQQKSNFSVTVKRLQGKDDAPFYEDLLLEFHPSIGLGLEIKTHRQEVVCPLDIDVSFPFNASGSSAGLVLALSILDVLSEKPLTGSLKVSVTGSIDTAGNVLEVGGINLKALTTLDKKHDLFLCPLSQVEEAKEVLKNQVKVVGVETLWDAVEKLVENGGNFPVLSALHSEES